MLRSIIPLLLLFVCLPTSPARAQPDSALRATTVFHGVKLTLTIHGRVYPRNAVIQVKLTVKNVSQHAIYLASGLQAPTAYVLDSSGMGVYDPLMPLGNDTLITYKGPGPRSLLLHRGKTWEADPYLVLRGNRIGYSMIVGRVERGGGVTVNGRPVTVRLAAEAPPQVNIASSPVLRATITPATASPGPLLYVSETSCEYGGASYSTGTGWSIADSMGIEPVFYTPSGPDSDCTGTRVWHALAGWLNHPVATISYTS